MTPTIPFWFRCRVSPRPALDFNADRDTDVGPPSDGSNNKLLFILERTPKRQRNTIAIAYKSYRDEDQINRFSIGQQRRMGAIHKLRHKFGGERNVAMRAKEQIKSFETSNPKYEDEKRFKVF
ncbi:hypothetical protein EVAR_69316_1 [Eumeta japonica]|uniref:Uncharacterized protein n=1 Tax=Eumeta variegata TaxID=151549 RepID=A0A4C1TLN5_EUMVA|nr:hypothetical protein EVAR_69316_1 [Eumeta japonica]